MNLERIVNVLKKAVKGTAVGVGGLAGLYAVVVGGSLGLAVVSGTEIVTPSTPPRVHVSSHATQINPAGYSGAYLTKYQDGKIEIMLVGPPTIILFDQFFPEPHTWYTDIDGDRKVDEVVSLRGGYDRKKDLAQNPKVFEQADREFNEVLKKYGPYLAQIEGSFF